MSSDLDHAFLAGRRAEAVEAVPDELVDATSLVGSPDRIQARIREWRAMAADNSIGSMLMSIKDVETLRVVAQA